MTDNKTLIEKLTKAQEFFAKENDHVVFYNPKTGKYELNPDKIRKEDKRNFVNYVKAALKNTSIIKKIDDISGLNYEVYIKGGPSINKYDVKVVKDILGDKAYVRDNLGNQNRDITEITIKFYKK